MMNLKNYAENHGKKVVTIFVLIDLRKDLGRYCVCVMKAKKTYTEAIPQTNPFFKTNESYS